MSPPDRSNAIPHELLLDQAGFLRRLARDLVRDPHAAEDAVQDVMLTALERPPRHEGNLHGWLAAVLKNLVSKRSRAHVRRAHYEQEAARTSARGGDALPAQTESTVRSVTEAVLALDEPYRSTVLLRYFEDLTPSAIAERQAVSVATVKSRLQRALEILRVRMERERGSAWTSGLIGLAWPAAATHSISIAGAGKGVLAMTLKSKFAVGVAALLVAWFVVHEFAGLRGGPSEPFANSSANASLGAPSEAPSPSRPALEAGTTAAERTTSKPDPALAATVGSSDLPDTLIIGSLLDSAGKPIRNAWSAWCSITDVNGVRMNSDAKSGGAFIFTRMPYGKYWITASAFGFRMAHDVLELQPGAAHVRKDITLPRQPLLRIRATTPDGRILTDVLKLDRFGSDGITLVPVATRDRPGPMIDEIVGSLNNPFGVGQFWEYGPLAEKLPRGCLGFVLLDQDPPVYMSLLNWHAVLQTKEVHPGDEEVDFVLRPEDVIASMASIRVQVMDADGLTPLAGAGATLVCHGEEKASAVTGPDGIALLEKMIPCEGELVLSAKDRARLSVRVSARPGVLTDMGQVTLEQGITLQAHVTNESGAPVSAQFSLLHHDRATGKYINDRQWVRGSDADGILSIPALGRESYLLRTSNLDAAFDQEHEGVKLVSANVVVDLRSGVAPNALDIRLVPASTLTLILNGESDDRLQFRVNDSQGLVLVSGRFWMVTPHPLSLPPGNYAVELLDPQGNTLSTKSVTLGTTPVVLELAR